MKNRRKSIVWGVLAQILVTGVLLVIFAFFHHVLPRIKVAAQLAAATPTPVATATPAPTATPEVVATPTPTPSNLTEWQQKFADKFTDEVVSTETSYTSPEVAIHISTNTFGEGSKQTVYYVADIYVAQLENFRSGLVGEDFVFYATQPVEEISQAHNALLAVNGDFTCYQLNDASSITFRDGKLFREGPYSSYQICALFNDGTMKTYGPGQYTTQGLIEQGLWQIWHFGPSLINEDGSPNLDNYGWQEGISYVNPRCAVGYYEPGHYCFLVADGRQDGYSVGLRLSELAQIMADMGCASAYNLDGGGSAVMYFNGAAVNKRSNSTRALGDILYIAELPKEEG